MKEFVVFFRSSHIELKGNPEKPVVSVRRDPDGILYYYIEVPPSACQGSVDALAVTDEEAHRIWVFVLRYLYAKDRIAFKPNAGRLDWVSYKFKVDGRADLSRAEKPAGKVRNGNDVMFHWRGRAKRHAPSVYD